MYNNQDLIGRRLRLLKSTLQDFESDDEVEVAEIASRIKRISEIDLISTDPQSKALIKNSSKHLREEASKLALKLVDMLLINTGSTVELFAIEESVLSLKSS